VKDRMTRAQLLEARAKARRPTPSRFDRLSPSPKLTDLVADSQEAPTGEQAELERAAVAAYRRSRALTGYLPNPR
jgi:hypothetical protein